MIRDILDYIVSLLKSRLLPLALIFLVLASTLINRLFSLQIIKGDSYVKDLNNSIKKTTSVASTRGRIFDKNGVLLAYNDLAFAVKISDSGTYTATDDKSATDVKNETINNAIEKTLNIIESKGDKFTNDFSVSYGDDGNYSFTVEGTALLRFLRDSYGATSIADMKEEQKNSTANQLIDYMCDRYGVDKDNIKPEHVLEILNLRRYMSANSYNRYMTFTIANEVSDKTVAAILESSDELVGVTVEEQYIRRYVDGVYCSQILGYTGTVSASELEELQAQNLDYEQNDVIGKTGIEQTLEKELSGQKGSKTVYIDTVGHITEVVDETPSTAGHDVYLTIDANLQKQIYNAIEDEIVSILLTYITNGGSKYVPNSSGGSDTVMILINEVYFALIDNNIVSLDKIAQGNTSTEQQIYQAFLSKQADTMNWLESEMTDNPTDYSKLTDEQKQYIWYIYKNLLVTEGIFKTDKVDASDEIFKDWNAGGSVSLEELLKYAISQNWIDMSKLSTAQYSSLNETYDALRTFIADSLKTDSSFFKKMYKYMIESGSVSGRQVCMLLFEQNVLNNDDEYNRLSSGSLGAYEFMRNAISKKEITPAQLALKPCSGSAVITDPRSGDVRALVSYPSYDNNRMSGSIDAAYYNQLNNDKSLPLRNWATQAQSAPGSTFKPLSAITALESGLISTSTTFFCGGQFTEVTPSPWCWNHSGHGSENVTTAIRDSCNVFFYNVGYKLAYAKNGQYNEDYAMSVFKQYAEEVGLATSSGIEISEKTPHASDVHPIPSAIGQGNHAYSALNLARYVTTLANEGTVYNLTLVDKVTDSDGNLIYDNVATVANQCNYSSTTWSVVHNGMQLAAQGYAKLNASKYNIAAKSGTAQESEKDPDHSLLISFAPLDNPEVAVSVDLMNGYTSATSMELSAKIYDIYYGANSGDNQ